MGVVRDLYHFILEFIRFVRDPRAYSERVSHKLEQGRIETIQAIEQRYGSLDFKPKTSDEIRRFATLAEAVDFIAVCLEEDRPSELASEIEGMRGLVEYDQDYPYYFVKAIFCQLRDIYEERDLRQLYGERAFPADKGEYKLGGHASELGCIHIDFFEHEGA